MSRQYGALSGIAIVLIVLNHAIALGSEYPVQHGYPTVEGWLRDLLNIFQALGVFAVPIFLFISGSFLTYAARGNDRLSFKFVYAGLRHIAWPYLVWSLVFYVLILLHYGDSYSILGYIKNLLVGYPYHFVPLIIFWYLLSPLLIGLGKKHGLLLLCVIGFYQLVLIIIKEQDALGVMLPGWTEFIVPPVLFNPLAEWAIYLPLGVVLGLHAGKVRPWLAKFKWLFVVLTVILFALSILNVFGLLRIPLVRYFVPLPFMLVMPVINRNVIPLVRQFERIGKRSYGIYLMHLIVMDITLALVQQVAAPFLGYSLLLMIVLFSLGLSVPLRLMEIVAHGPTRRFYPYVFG